MGKRLKQQVRGKGTPRYRAKSHRFKAKVSYNDFYPKAVRKEKPLLTCTIKDFVDAPERNTILAKVKFNDGNEGYLIASEGIVSGSNIEIGEQASIKLGNVLPLKSIPEGFYIYNIEKQPGDGGKIAKAAGSFAQILMKSADYVQIKLPSNKIINLNPECLAQVGVAAGGGIKEKPLLKAGNAFYKYRKAANAIWPRVRGVKMSAYDHPFGGKEHHGGKPTTVGKHAVPGQKVGHLRAKMTGRKSRKTAASKQQNQ
ncbi:MAG: 50S ribosomal protein L2 [Candidatus Anstonellales archaeon]